MRRNSLAKALWEYVKLICLMALANEVLLAARATDFNCPLANFRGAADLFQRLKGRGSHQQPLSLQRSLLLSLNRRCDPPTIPANIRGDCVRRDCTTDRRKPPLVQFHDSDHALENHHAGRPRQRTERQVAAFPLHFNCIRDAQEVPCKRAFRKSSITCLPVALLALHCSKEGCTLRRQVRWVFHHMAIIQLYSV